MYGRPHEGQRLCIVCTFEKKSNELDFALQVFITVEPMKWSMIGTTNLTITLLLMDAKFWWVSKSFK